MCCGPGSCGLEGNVLVEVLYKNLDKATSRWERKGILSFPLVGTEAILRRKKFLSKNKNPVLETKFISFTMVGRCEAGVH